MLALIGLFKPILDLLTSAGIIKTPEQQAQLQQQLQAAAAEADQSFADFVKATQPTGQVVAGVPWFINLIGALQNLVVAMVRPAISFFCAYQVYLHPRDYTTPLYLVPILFWFTGRTVEKLMNADGFSPSDFAPAPAPAPVPQRPAAPIPQVAISSSAQAGPQGQWVTDSTGRHWVPPDNNMDNNKG